MGLLNWIPMAINLVLHSYLIYFIVKQSEGLGKVSPFAYTLFSLSLYAILFNQPFLLLVFSINWFCFGGFGGITFGVFLLIQCGLAIVSMADGGNDLGPGRIYRAVPRGPLVRVR